MRGSLYSCARVFRQERERIFGRGWTIAAPTTGSRVTFDAATGVPLFTHRERVFVNSCPHRMNRLVEDGRDHRVIRCGYHNWCFKDGALIRAPGIADPGARQGLRELPNRRVGPLTAVELGATAPGQPFASFEELCDAGSLSELVPHSTEKLGVAANWKLVMENFLDYLHVPAIHPDLAPSSKGEDHHPAPCRGRHIAFRTTPIGDTPRNPLTRLRVPRAATLPADTLSFHVLFPNAFLFVHPTHVFAVVVHPKAPDESLEIATLLVHPETLEASPDDVNQLARFYQQVNREDVSIVESCQRGVGADLRPQLHMPHDRFLRDFQRMYLAELG